MSRTYLPRAVAAGARLMADCRVSRLEHDGRRVRGVSAVQGGTGALRGEPCSINDGGMIELVREDGAAG